MTSVKVKFRASMIECKEGAIYYQIIKERMVRQIKTSYRINVEEWDEASSNVTTLFCSPHRTNYLKTIKGRIKHDYGRLKQIAASLEKRDVEYDADTIATLFNRQANGVTLFNFMQTTIARLIELKKYRTSETYQTTLNSFMRFCEGEDILMINISSDVMISYEAYLKDQGITMNTISFYMRILRALYNRAVEDELIEQRFPFKRVYTGVDKTVKRALPLKSIKGIKALDLATDPKLMFARDLFLFSFYTRGMSFVDMAFLRKKDLKNNIISYRRRKTGQQLFIRLEGCMKAILDKYQTSDSEYLLPILKGGTKDSRSEYRNMLCVTNKKLKQIGEMVGLSTPLTLYVARHSWASVAKSRNIPISVISEGMGHDSEATTQIYLASLDTSVVDRANRMILKLL